MNLEDAKAILDKACLICGRMNRDHKVYYSPHMNWFQRNIIQEEVRNLVPSSDHYACIDNLEYLEWKAKQNEKESK